MPYISYNGQLFEVTQAQYDSYTVGATPPAGAVNLTAGLANDLPLASGGTQLLNNSATTPILTPNTTNTTPGQTLTTTQATVNKSAVDAATQQLIDAGLYDPGLGFQPNGQPVTVASASTTTNSTGTPNYIVSQTTDKITGQPRYLVVGQNGTDANSVLFVGGDANIAASLASKTTITAADVQTATIQDTNAAGGTRTFAVEIPPGQVYRTANSVAGISTTSGNSAVPVEASLTTNESIVPESQVNTSATAVAPGAGTGITDQAGTGTGATTATDSAAATSNIQGLVQNAQNQQTIADQRKQVNNADWRVRLRLAPQADYLYKAQKPGILQPLAVTDGIIFPYTPTIQTAYRAQYNTYDLTHSNYRGYWYQNSYVDQLSLNATFTAQDTNDANYLLAVIHFLRSATKMFYGNSTNNRGSPPPVCYLSGFGDYQFREHACLISQFTYNLPADVDYIRAGSPNNVGLNLTSIRDRQSVATNTIFSSINRLAAAFLTKGGVSSPPPPPTLGLNRPTYVPTKMEIQLTLLPVQSRNQVSKVFNYETFASGDQLKGGFW